MVGGVVNYFEKSFWFGYTGGFGSVFRIGARFVFRIRVGEYGDGLERFYIKDGAGLEEGRYSFRGRWGN